MKKFLRFSSSLLFIMVLSVLLYAFAMFQGGFVSWFLLFSFLPVFIYQIGLLLYPVNNWKVSRTFTEEEITAGDSMSVIIHMERRLRFPLYYLVIEEVFPQTLQTIDIGAEKYQYLNNPSQSSVQRQFKKVVFPWFKKRIDIPYLQEGLPRGIHELDAIRVRTTDIFGFVKKEHIFYVKDVITVYPAIRPVRFVKETKSIEQGATTSTTFARKQTNMISGTREYAAGDKISWIDWKQTARNRQMMTKEFEQEKNTDVLCMLDHCMNEHLTDLAFEATIELSLSFMKSMQKDTSRLDLLSVGKNIERFSSDDRTAILQHLAQIKPNGKVSFANQLPTLITDIEQYATVMIVTAVMDEALQEALLRLHQQTQKISLVLVQSSVGLPSISSDFLHQLAYEGIKVCILTEKELTNDPVEVNI